jgi:hypothetical protein
MAANRTLQNQIATASSMEKIVCEDHFQDAHDEQKALCRRCERLFSEPGKRRRRFCSRRKLLNAKRRLLGELRRAKRRMPLFEIQCRKKNSSGFSVPNASVNAPRAELRLSPRPTNGRVERLVRRLLVATKYTCRHQRSRHQHLANCEVELSYCHLRCKQK